MDCFIVPPRNDTDKVCVEANVAATLSWGVTPRITSFQDPIANKECPTTDCDNICLKCSSFFEIFQA